MVGWNRMTEDATKQDSEDYVARVAQRNPRAFARAVETYGLPKQPASLTTTGAIGGLVGATLGAVAVPLVDVAREGCSWQNFVKAAPKTSAIGLTLGAGAGWVAGMLANRRRKESWQGFVETTLSGFAEDKRTEQLRDGNTNMAPTR